MQQPLVKKNNVAGITTFNYVLADVQPEPERAPLPTDQTVPCAYCRRLTPPVLQAALPWYWPGIGWVTNCLFCAGEEIGFAIPKMTPSPRIITWLWLRRLLRLDT